MWSTPSRNTIDNLIKREYQYAIPHVKNLLGSAKGLIHLTFDGWTSRQNDPYLPTIADGHNTIESAIAHLIMPQIMTPPFAHSQTTMLFTTLMLRRVESVVVLILFISLLSMLYGAGSKAVSIEELLGRYGDEDFGNDENTSFESEHGENVG
jgi:hypothetical protein